MGNIYTAGRNLRFLLLFLLGATLCVYSAVFAQSGLPRTSSEEICTYCHQQEEVAGTKQACTYWMHNGHPVYVTPSEKVDIPRKYPLNNGQIYCGTCHITGTPPEGVEKNPYLYTNKVFLRFENNNSSMCVDCHPRMQLLGKDVKGARYDRIVTGAASRESERSEEVEKTYHIYNHPVDVNTGRIPKIILEAGGTFGKSKDTITCETCHLPHQAADDKLLVMDNRTSRLCGLCHPDMVAADRRRASRRGTHPVNVIPSLAPVAPEILDAGGRLGEKGEIICLTCHRMHQSRNKKALLVQENKQSSFCILCHKQEAYYLEKSKHDLRFSAPREKNSRGKTARESGVCESCHFAHKGSGAKMWAKDIFDPAQNSISQLCASCHSREGCAEKKTTGEFSHPVGVSTRSLRVTRSILPLFDETGTIMGKGEITCASCHNVHRWDALSAKKGGLEEEGDFRTSFLRMSNKDSAICKDCHGDKWRILGTEHDPLAKLFEGLPLLKDEKSRPLSICEQCHVTHGAASVMLWRRELGSGGDDMSRICSGCHSEGKTAAAKQVGEFSHPVGRSILELGRRAKSDLPLFDAAMSPDARGMVFCNSCHDVHQWDPDKPGKGSYKKVEGDGGDSFLRLAVNGGRKELCGACHKEKAEIAGTRHDLRASAPGERNAADLSPKEAGLCGSCHAAHNAVSGFFLWNKEQGEGRDLISRSCNACHSTGKCAEKKQIGHSHPVNVQLPEGVAAEGLPTYNEELEEAEGGRVYCITCHDTHRQRAEGALGRAMGGKTGFLRAGALGRDDMCLKCHPERATVKDTAHDLSLSAPAAENKLGRGAGKDNVCEGCHLVHKASSPVKIWAREPGPGGDGFSRLCNSCHSAGRCAQKKPISADSHPVNVSIMGSGGVSTLPLFNEEGGREKYGKVTCGTCHDSHQWRPGKAAKGEGRLEEGDRSSSFLRIASTSDAALCFDCHREKKSILDSPHNLAVTRPREVNIMGQTPAASGVCGTCHLVHNSSVPAMVWARRPGPDKGLAYWDENILFSGPGLNVSLCTSCHRPEGAASGKIPKFVFHPDNHFVIQKQAKDFGVPFFPEPFKYIYGQKQATLSVASIDKGFFPRFPVFDKKGAVSWEGSITCSTCHDSHQYIPPGVRVRKDPLKRGNLVGNFLRPGIVDGLCSDCHANTSYYLYTYYHRSRPKTPITESTVHWTYKGCRSCHEKQPEGGRYTRLKIEGDINKLCLSCHDGKKAAGEIHPVGFAMRADRVGLPLYKGQMACTTCHDMSRHQTVSGNMKLTNPSFLRVDIGLTPTIGPRRSITGAAEAVFPGDRLALCVKCHGEGDYQRFNPHQQQLGKAADKIINEQVCLLCHKSFSREEPISDKDYKLRVPIEKHCIGCHPRQTKQHPSNVDHFGKPLSPITLNVLKMSMRIDIKSIPLADGKLVCPTCHNPHQKGVPLGLYSQKKGQREVRDRFVGYGSCINCHRKGGAPSPGSPF